MKLFLLFITVLFACTAAAQQRVQFDTSVVEARSFSKSDVDEFKKDKAFQYEGSKEPVKSWWDRFWSWVWYKIMLLLSTKEGRTTLSVVFIVVGVALISFFVVKVMGMNKDGLLGRSSKANLDYTVSAHDIHSISFDEAIQEAITEGNYRFATRLLYLQTLKRLADKDLIQWKINKTNSDYQDEVNHREWAPLFKSLTYNFDYTWYGEMPINKERFEAVHEQFQSFNNQL
jgi:hypothetical protein